MKPNSFHNIRNIFDGIHKLYIKDINNEERKKYIDS